MEREGRAGRAATSSPHSTAAPFFVLNPPTPHSPHVAFCGYSIPHPSEKVVNLRIQTTGEISAAAALRQAAADLKAAAMTLKDTFTAAVGAGEAGAPVAGTPPPLVPQ